MGSYDDKYVCAECIVDDALGRIVTSNACSKKCTYCGRQSQEHIAAVLDIVTEHMAECIARVYADPVEVLPWDGREGGYQAGTVYNLWELLEEVELCIEDEQLLEDITDSFDQDEWCKRDWQILSPSQRKVYGWQVFKEAVKHKRRYTFWSMGDEQEEEWHPDYWPVGKTLDEIAASIRETGLIKQIQTGTAIWRVRIHKEKHKLIKDSDFTAPPVEKAIQSNRMSPAGVPMFYGADDFDTACQETVYPGKISGKLITGGCFKTVTPLYILVLVDIKVPSLFNKEAADIRNDLIFLQNFARDLSEPIQQDGREHIEYVPTQAFTEYVRWEMKTDGQSIDGIRYRSSKNGKSCYVLFCEQDECVDEPKFLVERRWLNFDLSSLTSRCSPDKK
ncbi:MAG TPA: RES domain-containing protein [Phycisphaerales bacterium]|nr:RES domain-containing protein [Phycisphaerales bacterium]